MFIFFMVTFIIAVAGAISFAREVDEATRYNAHAAVVFFTVLWVVACVLGGVSFFGMLDAYLNMRQGT